MSTSFAKSGSAFERTRNHSSETSSERSQPWKASFSLSRRTCVVDSTGRPGLRRMPDLRAALSFCSSAVRVFSMAAAPRQGRKPRQRKERRRKTDQTETRKRSRGPARPKHDKGPSPGKPRVLSKSRARTKARKSRCPSRRLS